MESRLTRAEYWLLNAVVEVSCPLTFLDTPHIEVLFNKASHGLSRDRLIATLTEMFELGWITAHRHTVGSDDDQELDRLSAQSIESALNEAPPVKRLKTSPCTFYRLTPLGASVWEEFAAPDWNRYLSLCLPFSGSGEYIGATEWRLRKYLDLVHHLDIQVHPATVAWDVVQPFEATYWKTLPLGYRVSFEFERTESLADWSKVPHEVMSLQLWYDWR